jgi:hypothetical protein
MSLFRSLEHHFCLSVLAQRSILRGARSVRALAKTGFDPQIHWPWSE